MGNAIPVLSPDAVLADAAPAIESMNPAQTVLRGSCGSEPTILAVRYPADSRQPRFEPQATSSGPDGTGTSAARERLGSAVSG